MKKILTIVGAMLIMMILISCCSDKKPPHRAIYSQTSGYGMQYHIVLYEPTSAGGTHSFKCQSWNYTPSHIYTDELGKLSGDEVIWKNLDGRELPFEDNGQNMKEIELIITNTTVQIRGVKGGILNGTYKIETSSPDSWGVPIEEGIQIPNEQ